MKSVFSLVMPYLPDSENREMEISVLIKQQNLSKRKFWIHHDSP